MSDLNKNNIDHNQFNNVPEEIINYIWQYLTSPDHTVLVQVCRRFRYNTLGYYDIVSKENLCSKFASLRILTTPQVGTQIMVALGMNRLVAMQQLVVILRS